MGGKRNRRGKLNVKKNVERSIAQNKRKWREVQNVHNEGRFLVSKILCRMAAR